jgi:hypothetical protein
MDGSESIDPGRLILVEGNAGATPVERVPDLATKKADSFKRPTLIACCFLC